MRRSQAPVIRHLTTWKPDPALKSSPLYDFAPMFLDPEGIARASRWEGIEATPSRSDWRAIAELFGKWFAPEDTAAFLKSQAEKVAALPECMKMCAVEDEIIEGVAKRCAEIANDLRSLD